MGAAKSQKQGTSDRRKQTKVSKVPFEKFRFVRIELTEAEKNEFREMHAGGEFGPEVVDEWIDTGYKLSVSRDGNGTGVVASISAVYTDAPNSGLVLTGRGGTVATALAVLQYKDRILSDENGWAATEDQRGGSYSDIG